MTLSWFRLPAGQPLATELPEPASYDVDNSRGKVQNVVADSSAGGYCLVPPSLGHCHRSGRPYLYISDRTLVSVATISPEERETLIEAARSFDVPPPVIERPRPQHNPRSVQAAGRLPGEDFNARGDWTEILERNGWTFDHDDGAGTEYWCRPGKRDAVSATVNYAGLDLLHNFSSSVSALEPDNSYTKFQFVALVEHGGYFKQAAEALRREGYGRPSLRAGSRRHRRRARRRTSRRRNHR